MRISSRGIFFLSSSPLNRLKQYDPEDSSRFYALCLHEVGMITVQPQPAHRPKGTDWRFLNELKRELKA
jgi:NitT/TauT family transport system substrate-binding protein